MPETDTLEAENEAPALEAPPTGLRDPQLSEALDKLFTETKPAKAEPAVPPKKDEKPATEPKAPAVEPKTAATPEDDIPAEIKSPKARENFKAVVAARKAAEKERDSFKSEKEKLTTDFAQLQKDLEAAKKASPGVKVDDLPEFKSLKSEHERITKEMEQYSTALRRADVQSHPKFKQAFDTPLHQTLESVKSYAGEKAVNLLKMPDSEYRTEQLDAIVTDLGPTKGGKLTAAMAFIDQITMQRDAALADEQAHWKNVQAQETLAEQNRREAMTKAFADVKAEVAASLPVFQPREGDKEWNDSIAKDMALAEHIYGGELKPDERARAAFWSASASRLLSSLKAEQDARTKETTEYKAKVAEYEKMISDLRAPSPSPGSENAEAGDIPAKESLAEHMARNLPFLK